MAAKTFISYSHLDEKALERLHKHLAILLREGTISAWFDHAILAGAQLGQIIQAELDSSDIFLALVSPDYLASNYCYEKEFQHALQRARSGSMRLIPIILEPCDWLSSPLSEFMALPKDGKPVSEWTNANNAYLDVVTGIRRAAQSETRHATGVAGQGGEAVVRKVRLKRDFDSIDKTEFADRTYKSIYDYFSKAAEELSRASDDIKTRVEEMGSTAFTCTIVNRAKIRQGEAHITVHNSKSRHGMGDINYVFEAHAGPNTSNGGIRVEADEYNLYLKVDNFYGGRDGEKYSPERASEWLWDNFVQKAGIEYE